MTDREALKLALEAHELDMVPDKDGHMVFRIEVAITALRERLAQPEEKYEHGTPLLDLFTQRSHCDRCGKKLGKPDHIHTCSPQVQEPVIDKSAAIRIATALGWEPRREWQGLTVAQIEEAFQQSAGADEDTHIRFARAIEAKIKEKNT